MKPKILFVAPIGELPSGQSIISDKVKKVMNEAYEIEFINLIKEGHAIGFNSFSRAKTILKLILEFYKKSKNVDFIYLTPSESIAGNFRDFFFLFYRLF